LDELKNRYTSSGHLLGTKIVDIIENDFEKNHPELLNKFDTVFSLNVLEHVKNEKQFIENCKKLLKPGGQVVILVPAFNILYNRLDTNLYHYRRYTKKSLNQVMSEQFEIKKTSYFNLMGIPAWYISGKLFRDNVMKKGKVDLYNKLVPIFKIIDKITLKKVGLSVISVGQKP